MQRGLVLILTMVTGLGGQIVLADESAKDIVATTVRSEGYPCDEAQQVEADKDASKPDEMVWTLQCSDGKYWVRYRNDEPAIIRPFQ